MSASDKKKLRKEQNAAKLSERQRKEQAEAKKLKIYTTVFVVVILAVLITALSVIGINAYKNYGVTEHLTVAATVGDHKLSTVVMSYYYHDAVSELYSEYASSGEEDVDTYLKEIVGLDTSVALDQQTNPQTEQLWSEYFLSEAVKNARNDYAMCDLAKENDFKLSEEQKDNIDVTVSNIEMYASIYGYPNADMYLRTSYGSGASLSSYRKYIERRTIAEAYAEHYKESLTFDDATMREYEADKYNNYTSYTYSNVYLSINAFLPSNATDEDRTAARVKLTEAADILATATNVEELETKLNELELEEGKRPTLYKEQTSLYPTLTATNADLAAWICDDARTEGEVGAIENNATSTNEAGEQVTETNGYYIVIFHNKNENKMPLSNVRHLLVKFIGGTEDEETGEVVYSEEEKAATREKAEGFLNTWKEGPATEDSFVELLLENSEDNGVETNEGLYEDISPASGYVKNFLNWAIDPARQVGDTDIVETEYGYHVMYFSSHSDLTYRDQMISDELRASNYDEWYKAATEAVTTSIGNTGKMKLDLILSPQ